MWLVNMALIKDTGSQAPPSKSLRRNLTQNQTEVVPLECLVFVLAFWKGPAVLDLESTLTPTGITAQG